MKAAGAFALVTLLLLQGCGAPAPRPDIVPEPIKEVEPGPIIARDKDFVIVVVRPGEDATTLAERYLGDRQKSWWISEMNGGAAIRGGDTVVIPLSARNRVGVYVDGFQTVPILCYHRFGAKSNKLTVTATAFAAQMDFLAKNGYHVIPLARFSAFLEGSEALPKKSVVLTIDDGYRATYDIAWPILKKHGFPATVFLYSDFVGASDALSWPQMKDMVASGVVDIQPHSKTHANLTLRLPTETDAKYRERMRREVDAPIGLIQDRLALSSLAYAYPYGDVNDTVIDALKHQGVRTGLTVTPGGNSFFAYPFMLRRSMVFGNDDLEAFKSKLVTFVRTTGR